MRNFAASGHFAMKKPYEADTGITANEPRKEILDVAPQMAIARMLLQCQE